MDYGGNLIALAQYAGDGGYATDPDFTAQFPIFILSAEQRILRDLDLLSTRVEDNSGYVSANNRRFPLPTHVGTFQVVETVAIYLSESQLYPNQGVQSTTLFRQAPLQWVSKEFMDAAYPDDHAVGAPSVPRFIAPYTDKVYLVGPAPDMNYQVAVYGVQWPAPLSQNNPTTFISVNLPDLLLAAEMIDVSAWQRQFSAMADDPAQARDWTQEYERLKGMADVLELRRKVQASGWSTRRPDPVADTKG